MNVPGEFGIAGLELETVGQMYIVIVDESHGNSDERDVTSKAAIMEPVDANGGNAIDEPSGVHGDDDEVGSGAEDFCDFTIKRREAAFVIADALLVDPNVGTVVGCTDVEEGASTRLGLCVEVSLVPEDTLVVEELGDLGVPVAGDPEGGSGREIVLFVVLADDIRVIVHGVGLVIDRAIASVESVAGRLVNEVMPVSVEAGDGAMVDTNEQGLEGLLAKHWEHQSQTDECNGNVAGNQM